MAEDVTGTPFQTYMKNSVFSRLGMNSSDFAQPMAGSLATRAAKAHDLDGNVVPGGWNTYPELIAAGLWTTSSDLARLLVEVQNAAAANAGALLTQQTAARMLTQQPNSTMGLGFALTNGKGGLMFNHTGSNLGYKSYVGAYRDREQGIAIMTNGENGISLLMEIVRAAAKVYGWPDRFVEEASLVELPLSVLQSYVGNYTATLSGQTLQAEIYLAGSTLAMKVAMAGTGQRSDLYATATETFLLRENVLVPGTLTFSRDGTGNVTGFSIALQEGGTVAATKGDTTSHGIRDK